MSDDVEEGQRVLDAENGRVKAILQKVPEPVSGVGGKVSSDVIFDAAKKKYGVTNDKEDKAKEKMDKAQAAYDAAVAERAKWDAFKAEHEAVMAKQQQADAAANAEAESQRVAEEEWRAAEQAAADEQARKEREQTEVNAPLSDEVNKFGVPFVLSSDGTTTFGEVAVESGLKAAPIKLSLGENSVDDEGVNHGYGYLHIDAGHGQQILSPETGFKSIEEFVETVARNYDTIREGNQVAGNQTYLLELSDEHNNTLFIQLSHDGSYWNVNSAGIFRKKYSRRMREVASLLTIGNSSSTETVEVNRGQKDGATATSENSSLTSGGKGSAENAAVQGNGEKIIQELRILPKAMKWLTLKRLWKMRKAGMTGLTRRGRIGFWTSSASTTRRRRVSRQRPTARRAGRSVRRCSRMSVTLN